MTPKEIFDKNTLALAKIVNEAAPAFPLELKASGLLVKYTHSERSPLPAASIIGICQGKYMDRIWLLFPQYTQHNWTICALRSEFEMKRLHRISVESSELVHFQKMYYPNV